MKLVISRSESWLHKLRQCIIGLLMTVGLVGSVCNEGEARVSGAKGSDVYAVLIGINRYQDRSIRRLQFTDRDVNGIHNALTGPGQVPARNVLVLSNERATKRRVEWALRTWLPNKVRGNKQATVIVFFSGHGWTNGTVSYWLAYDTENSGSKKIEQTAVSHEVVSSLLKKRKRLPAGRVLLFVDACHSGATWASAGDLSKQMVVGNERKGVLDGRLFGEGNVSISSSTRDKPSIESRKLKHGVFSYVLIHALQGAADYNGDGKVTLSEAWAYLSSHVEPLAKKVAKEELRNEDHKQVPVRDGTEAGEIVLSYPRPQKGILYVESIPSGASVEVDGVDKGEAPIRLKEVPGVKRLTLRLSGYKTWESRLQVYAGRERKKIVALKKIETVRNRPPIRQVQPPSSPRPRLEVEVPPPSRHVASTGDSSVAHHRRVPSQESDNDDRDDDPDSNTPVVARRQVASIPSSTTSTEVRQQPEIRRQPVPISKHRWFELSLSAGGGGYAGGTGGAFNVELEFDIRLAQWFMLGVGFSTLSASSTVLRWPLLFTFSANVGRWSVLFRMEPTVVLYIVSGQVVGFDLLLGIGGRYQVSPVFFVGIWFKAGIAHATGISAALVIGSACMGFHF